MSEQQLQQCLALIHRWLAQYFPVRLREMFVSDVPRYIKKLSYRKCLKNNFISLSFNLFKKFLLYEAFHYL